MKRFKRINFKDDALNRFQGNCGETFDTITSNPLLNGLRVDDIAIVSGTNKSVAHGLGREPQGWFVIGQYSASSVYEISRSSTFLIIDASANVTVDLWIF